VDGVATSDRYARSSSAQRFAVVVCFELGGAGANAEGSAVIQVAGLVLSLLNFDAPHSLRDRCASKKIRAQSIEDTGDSSRTAGSHGVRGARAEEPADCKSHGL